MNTFNALPKSRIFMLLFLLTFTAFTGAFSVSAQTEYQSRATGNWTSSGTWSSRTWDSTTSTWSAWANATTYPGQNAGTGAVSIIGGYNVTLNASIPNQYTSLTIGDYIFPPTQPVFDQLTIPENSNYVLNTMSVTIKDDGTIYWYKKGNLNILTNGVLLIYNSNPTAETNNPLPLSYEGCSANNKIHFGTLTTYIAYATCSGGGGQYSFANLNAAGGTINAVINSPTSTEFCNVTSVPLQGSFTGAYGTTTSGGTTPGVTYYWYVNGNATPVTSGTIATAGTTHQVYNLTTSPGTYNLEYKVTSYNASTLYTNSEFFTFTVYPPSAAGTVSTNQTICSGTAPNQLSLTGYVGTIQWQWSTDNSTFTDIPGATSATLSPGALTQTTYYRAVVTSGNCTPATSSTITVTVNPLPQGSLTGNTICPGDTGQLTFTATEGTGPFTVKYTYNSIEYTKNDVISGTAFNATPNPSSLGPHNYTLVSVANATCTRYIEFTGSTATITVSNTATTWTGTSNTNWDVAGNWTCGIPTSATDVTIPTDLTNYPVVEVTTAVCKNLTIDNGATLIINPGQLLTVGGKITGAETLANAGKIRVKASPDGTSANGSLIINCDANSKLVGTERTLDKIYGTIEFYTKAWKDEEATSWKDEITGSPTKGIIFNTKYKWQFFGVPVKEVITNPSFYGSFLRKYREDLNSTTTAKWEVLNNASKLEAFYGYEITQAAPKTIEIVGELQFCDKPLSLSRKAPLVTPDNVHFGLGQNIFGNSYTAAIKISKMENADNMVERTVYLYNTGSIKDWNAASLIVSPSNSATMTAGSYISIPWAVANTVWDDQIPSMQGFLLKYLPASTTFGATPDAQVILKYDGGGVAGNTRPQLAPQAAEEPLKYLRVNLQSASTVDNLWLFSREGTSSSFDNGWDGHKHFGTPTAFIYSMTPDGPMQVNTDRTIDGSVINFYANEDTDYTLTLVKSNLDEYSDLKLIDFETKTVTPLTAEVTRYNFSSTSTRIVEKRFMIVNSASKIDFKKNDFELLYGYLNADKTLIVTNFSSETGIMTLSTASGLTVMNQPLATGTSHFPTSLKAGAYILSLEAGGKRTSIKVLVNNK